MLGSLPWALLGQLLCWDCLEFHQIYEFRLNLVNSSFTLSLLYPLSRGWKKPVGSQLQSWVCWGRPHL